MAKCSDITQAGTACKGVPIDSSQWCYVHHPDTTETRRQHGRRGGKRGGRGRPLAKVQTINERLEELAGQVIDKEVDRADAAVAGQLLNYVLRGISVSLKAKEQEELIERLESFEENLKNQKGRVWYGT
jgi:hypothetical protein